MTNPYRELTERETQIAKLVAKGCSNKEIAMYVGLTLSGVSFHIANIGKKLNVTRKTEIVAAMIRAGLA